MTLLGKIARRRPADLFLVAEAAVLLTFFRVSLALVPVRRIVSAITRGRTGEVKTEASASDIEAARRVQWAVSAVARHSVVEFVCFPQALAGYWMLRWSGVTSTIVYGVAKSVEGELEAHTWLVVGDAMVLGGDAAADFTPIERWS